MPVLFVKREDGRAAVLGARPWLDGTTQDIALSLPPDAVVEGRLVRDWPAGEHELSDESLRALGLL